MITNLFAAVEEVLDPETDLLVPERTYGCLPADEQVKLTKKQRHVCAYSAPCQWYLIHFHGLLQSYITMITHRYISSGLAPIKYNYNEIYISRACSNAKATWCLTFNREASLAAPMLIFVIRYIHIIFVIFVIFVIRYSFYLQLWISIKLFLQHGKHYKHRSNITNILVVRKISQISEGRFSICNEI